MPSDASLLVLVVAPTGADGSNICEVFKKAKLRVCLCRTVVEALGRVSRGAGAFVFTEEALRGDEHLRLSDQLEAQPAWSDLPLVLISSALSLPHWAKVSSQTFGRRTSVTLVSRPSSAAALVAAVNAALQVRRRQYQLRDLLAERDMLLASLEERVRERTAKLQELVAELETFSYSVSHDLRAPLRVMAGYAQVILNDFRPTLVPEVEHFVERISRSAERMDRLTQDVLAYTRLSRGEVTLEPVDLDVTINEILEEYPSLSSSRTSIFVRRRLGRAVAHAPSLGQALSNLVENALKFGRPNVPVKISIFARPRGNRVRICVKDNGVGIATAYRRKIFHIFERVASQAVPGTGIGLAIVKKAAERMGGSVGLSSRLGAGSEFWIELARPR